MVHIKINSGGFIKMMSKKQIYSPASKSIAECVVKCQHANPIRH